MTLPPAGKTFTADSVTGSQIIPASDAWWIEITEITSPPLGFTLQFNASNLTYAPGETASVKPIFGSVFKTGVALTGWTVLAASGTASFRQLEHGQ